MTDTAIQHLQFTADLDLYVVTPDNQTPHSCTGEGYARRTVSGKAIIHGFSIVGLQFDSHVSFDIGKGWGVLAAIAIWATPDAAAPALVAAPPPEMRFELPAGCRVTFTGMGDSHPVLIERPVETIGGSAAMVGYLVDATPAKGAEN